MGIMAAQQAWIPGEDSSSYEELVHLQRLYRICEGDRRAYCSNTKTALLQQRKIIHKLECEKHEFLNTLEKWTDYKSCTIDDRAINDLICSYETQKQKLLEKKKIVENQKTEIHDLENKISRLMFVHQTLSRHESGFGCNKMVSLEDKLENAFVHYNRLLHRNGELRTYIDHLVKQKNMHKFICKQLSDNLNDYREKIEKAMLTASETYNKRDDAYQKFQTLKRNQVHEHQVCGALLQEARRNVEQHRDFVEFVVAKHRKRIRKSGRTTSGRDETKARLDSAVKSQERSAEAMANFELFTYCSNLNNKMKNLLRENAKFQVLLKTSDEEEKEKEQKKREKCGMLQEELAEIQETSKDAEAKLANVLDTVFRLKSGIDNMLQLVGGNEELGGGTALTNGGEISEPALKRVLNEIENQVNVLLQTRRFMEISEQQLKDQERTMSSVRLPSSTLVSATASFLPDRDEVSDIEIPNLPIIPSLG